MTTGAQKALAYSYVISMDGEILYTVDFGPMQVKLPTDNFQGEWIAAEVYMNHKLEHQ